MCDASIWSDCRHYDSGQNMDSTTCFLESASVCVWFVRVGWLSSGESTRLMSLHMQAAAADRGQSPLLIYWQPAESFGTLPCTRLNDRILSDYSRTGPGLQGKVNSSIGGSRPFSGRPRGSIGRVSDATQQSKCGLRTQYFCLLSAPALGGS